MTNVDWRQAAAEAAERREREATALLLAAVGSSAPEEVTTVTVFRVPSTVVPGMHSDDTVVVTQLRVSVTRYNGRADDDGEGYVRVEMFAQEAKADGTPHGGRRPYWLSASNELAGPLLLAAMMRSLPVPKST